MIPFGLTEEELELLSAFNIEYVAGSFIIFFLSEYANIHHNKHFTTVLFLGAFYDPVHQSSGAHYPRQSRVAMVLMGDRKWTVFLGPSCLLGIYTQSQLPDLS